MTAIPPGADLEPVAARGAGRDPEGRLVVPEWSSREIGATLSIIAVYRRRIHGVSAPQRSGMDSAEGGSDVPCRGGVPGQDEASEPDVADGRDVPAVKNWAGIT